MSKALFRSIFFYSLLLSFTYSVGQEKFRAAVVDEDVEAITSAFIQNLRSNEIVMTDNAGYFTINGVVGDSLLISSMGNEIAIYVISEHVNPIIQLKSITYELKEIQVYDLKPWEAFKSDFLELEIDEPKVNVLGLPEAQPLPKPIHLRSNEFVYGPQLGNYIMNPISTMIYHFNDTEKEKRVVWDKIQDNYREFTYRQVVNADSVSSWVEIPDSLISPFIVYCNSKIEDKTVQNEYHYKSLVMQLWTEFIEEN